MSKDSKKKAKEKKFTISKPEQQTLRQGIYHPHPDVQRKCFAVLLLSFLFSATLVGWILNITPQSVRNYWNSYKKGGVKALQVIKHKGKCKGLCGYEKSIEADFEKTPPASIKEAAARIEKITGIKRSIKSVRNFLKGLKFRYRKVAGIPAKADLEKQEAFVNEQLNPILGKAKTQGETHVVFFVDAAHFVHSAFLGFLWSIQRVFIKTPSGRKRFNVLGAVNAITKKIYTICNETYINAETVCELLALIASECAGKTITLVLDNARYQTCKLVTNKASELGIQLLFLPTYSPNLNIIERLWKFIKKKSLNSKYYEKFSEFKSAIIESLEKSNEDWSEELESLLVLKFQKFSQEETKEKEAVGVKLKARAEYEKKASTKRRASIG